MREGLAVGFFDGVHLGHRAILERAAAALTFRNHPLSVLAPERAPRLVMSPEARLAAIAACGVSEVRALAFTPQLAAMSPEAFVAAAGLSTRGLILCGANWRFGRGGAGDADWLRAHGFAVEVVPYVDFRGEPVSSTRIRRALADGAVEDAAAMLGRPFRLSGRPQPGKGLGRTLGFPTLNIGLGDELPLLPLGVYVVAVRGVPALANFGHAPTWGERAWHSPVLEVHFPTDPPSLPDGPVDVDFLRFLRPERKFDSVEDLKRQIAADCAKISS